MAEANSKRREKYQTEVTNTVASLAILVLMFSGLFALFVFLVSRAQMNPDLQSRLDGLSQLLRAQKNPLLLPIGQIGRALLSPNAFVFALLVVAGAAISKSLDSLWMDAKNLREDWRHRLIYLIAGISLLIMVAYFFGVLAESVFHVPPFSQ